MCLRRRKVLRSCEPRHTFRDNAYFWASPISDRPTIFMPPWLAEPLRQTRIRGRRLVQKTTGWGSAATVGGLAIAAFVATLADVTPLSGVWVPLKGVEGAALQGGATFAVGLLIVYLARRATRDWRERWDDQPVRIWVLGKTRFESNRHGNSIMDSFTAFVSLENRSEQTCRCTLRVASVVEPIDFQAPRFVSSHTLPPNSEVPVDVAAWTRRSPPLTDDLRIYLIGPPAFFAEALAYLPTEPREIELEVAPDGGTPHRARCRVWVDTDRTLRLE